MPAITKRASERLVEARKRRGLPDTYGARLSRRENKLVLDFTSTPAEEDRVSTAGGLRIFLSPNVTPDLDGAVVDVQEKDGKERLVLLKTGVRS